MHILASLRQVALWLHSTIATLKQRRTRSMKPARAKH
jgi:hypothetical protein